MEQVEKLLKHAVKSAFGEKVDIELTRPDEQFGDFATNVALQLAKKLGKKPHEVAGKIIDELPKDEHIAGAEIAGPGFINITLKDSALLESLNADSPKTRDNKIVIETNNPNPFKDIHIGHAFNSIVADTIANLLGESGSDTIRVSYHGDVGLHVGKSLWAIFDECGEKAESTVKGLSDKDFPTKMREWYARGAGMYEEEPSVKVAIEDLTKQSFNPTGEVKKVYEISKNRSFDYFDSVFARLGSKPVKRRFLESESDAAGRSIVEANTGNIFEESDGAVVFKGEKYGLHTRVFITKRGTTLYEARDLGLIELKADAYEPDESYIVTAEEQKDYFKVVLKASELAMPRIKTKTINISTGTVKLTTGKMSSRKGEVITIEWLFDQIAEAVKKHSGSAGVTSDITLGAIRYAMLKSRFDSDIIFDIEQSVALEGNTGPYLQYTHARAHSILAKSDKNASLPADLQAEERSLARKLSEYSDALGRATTELMPHHICTYLYELAQVFNRFYEGNRIIGDPREKERLYLVKTYAKTLKSGLEILGIPAPERM